MNKRGVSMLVVSLILGLLTVVVLSAGTETGQNMWRYIAGVPIPLPNATFVPPGLGTLSEDEVKMINSVNALTCAINIIATGDVDFNDQNLCKFHGDKAFKPDQDITLLLADNKSNLTSPTGGAIIGLGKNARRGTITVGGDSEGSAQFGETQVECFGAQLETPTIGIENVNDLVEITTKCWQKFEKNNFNNVWCAYVHLDELKEPITEWQFREALRTSGDIGDDLAGTWIPPLPLSPECTFNLVAENYEWHQGGAGDIGCPLKKGEGTFQICGDNRGTNEIHLSRDSNECPMGPTGLFDAILNAPQTPEQLLSKRCTVTNFQLPQTLEGPWEEYIRGQGDPTYVFYYERFPHGEDEAWTIDLQEKYFSNAAMIGAVLAFAGPVAKTAKFLSGASIVTKGAGFLGKIGQRVAAGVLGRVARSAGGIISGLRVYRLAASVGGRARSLVLAISSATIESGRIVLKISDDSINLVKKMFSQADDIVKHADDIPKAYPPSVMREIAEEAIEAPSAHRFLADKLSKPFIENPAAVQQVRQLGRGGDDLVQALNNRQTQEAADAVNTLLKNGVEEGEIIGRLTSAYGDDMAQAMMNAGKARQASEAAELALTHPEIAAEVQRYSLAWNLGRWATHPKRVIAFAAAYHQVLMDSTNMKFMAVGLNTFGMHRPFQTPLTTDTTNVFYPITDQATSKFLMLQRDIIGQDVISRGALNQGLQRLFLASPCYADLQLTNNYCRCSAPDEGYALVDFGGGPTFVDTASINNEETTRDKRFEKAVRICNEPGVLDNLVGKDGILPVQCLTVHPELNDDNNLNFCYQGANIGPTVAKFTVLILNIGGGIALQSAGCAIPVPIAGCFVGAAASVALDYAAYKATAYINTFTKWPAH
ncbi:hypothetical protein GF342_05040 [Candidatus Woesearchaeota archaeon]|nr:hypothetical protein [Candidatus Woesearchaeota archaeon]